MRFSLGKYGIHTTHEHDYIVRYYSYAVNGADAFLVMCFETDAMILTRNGIEHALPGDFIIQEPSELIHHYSLPDSEEGFVNDWIYFSTEEIDRFRTFLNEIELPTGTLIHTHNPLFNRGYLQEIYREDTRMQPLYPLYISSSIEMMLLNAARFNSEKITHVSVYSEQLYALRMQMTEQFSEKWSVERMANTMHLSPSYFSIQYKRLFNISPIDDLVEIRISEAKTMLKSTMYSISEVAVKCGFRNEYYFSKMFKKRVNMSPTSYRNRFSTILRYDEKDTE